MPQIKKKREQFYESNGYGTVKVVEDIDHRLCIIEFLNTGFQKKVHWANVFKGKMRDDSVEYEQPTVTLNEVVESNKCGSLTIVWKKGKKCLVQFHETGYTKEANIDNVRVGKIRDPYYKSLYGRGYEGEYNKKDYPYWKQARQLWCNMMKRCYSEKDARGYYGKGVSVDSRWLCFANFIEDLPKLENFRGWLNGYKEGNAKYNLDKDLKIDGNKVYSREACGFVLDSENKSAGGINRQKMGWAKK